MVHTATLTTGFDPRWGTSRWQLRVGHELCARRDANDFYGDSTRECPEAGKTYLSAQLLRRCQTFALTYECACPLPISS